MKETPPPKETRNEYNTAVLFAYDRIVRRAKKLLSIIERDDLRAYYERKSVLRIPNKLIHEMISPLLYTRLECESDGMMAIRFGIEAIRDNTELHTITAQFLRFVFAATSREQTKRPIEACIKTDWFINSCNELYEYIDMDPRFHILKKVPCKRVSSTQMTGQLA